MIVNTDTTKKPAHVAVEDDGQLHVVPRITYRYFQLPDSTYYYMPVYVIYMVIVGGIDKQRV